MICKPWWTRGRESIQTASGMERRCTGCRASSGHAASPRSQNETADKRCSCSGTPGSRRCASSWSESRPDRGGRAFLTCEDDQEANRTVAGIAAVVPEIHDIHETLAGAERTRSVSFHFDGQRPFEDVRKERHRMHVPADLAPRRELYDEAGHLVVALGKADRLAGGSRRRLEDLRDLEADGPGRWGRIRRARDRQMHEQQCGRADERCKFHWTFPATAESGGDPLRTAAGVRGDA